MLLGMMLVLRLEEGMKPFRVFETPVQPFLLTPVATRLCFPELFRGEMLPAAYAPWCSCFTMKELRKYCCALTEGLPPFERITTEVLPAFASCTSLEEGPFPFITRCGGVITAFGFPAVVFSADFLTFKLERGWELALAPCR